MYKNYSVIRVKTGEELESFSTPEAAESFMIMMQSRGESVQIKTDAEDTDENVGFDIEGLDIEEPEIDFGSDLDQFNEDEQFDFGNSENPLDSDGLKDLDFGD